jgi:hypothetical protein
MVYVPAASGAISNKLTAIAPDPPNGLAGASVLLTLPICSSTVVVPR